MSMQFHIEWEDAINDAPAVCRTSGALRIEANGHSLTRNEDDWSQSVRQSVRVSGYPLALWLASSWWRLRWEPLPLADKATTSWRMAHEIAASGYGYLWPQLVLSCDGERMNYWSIASHADREQPIHYLANEHGSVSTAEFERAVDSFVQLVIERLDALHIANELKGLWAEVTGERADPAATQYRKLEAMLGFEPDEADAAVIERFVSLGERIGSTAIEEIAATCASANPAGRLDLIEAQAAQQGVDARYVAPGLDRPSGRRPAEQPWLRGRALAREVRGWMGLNGGMISDAVLAGLAEASSDALFDCYQPGGKPPLGLAVRHADGSAKVLLRKRNKPGRRFEFARLYGDHLLASSKDCWLPASDSKTARQQVQRAFAAELLCPIDALVERLNDDYSEDAREEAASYFGVSELMIRSHLVNNGMLPRSTIDAWQGGSAYPYAI